MEFIRFLVDFVIHLDKHLSVIIQNCGPWTYLLLFGIVFAETGLVVTPFLPGDSLLFACGAFAAVGDLNVAVVFFLLLAAAIIGDSVNYAIGSFFGPQVFHKEKARFLKKEYLEKTHQFYEKHGAKTIVIARFVPIVRTFAPFVAGVGKMNYLRFFTYNVAGALLWVTVLVFAGYFFGNIPIVKNNFTAVIFIIIFVSILPGIVEYLRHRQRKAKV
jgi:membrane-associated protein